MASVTFRKLEKSYGAVQIVKGIDLDIKDGEFVVFVGPSGCGKSTTLRMVAGLETITGGQLLIGDQVVNNLPPRDRDVAMVFQDYALYPHKTVRENMTFSLKIRGISVADSERRVNEAAEMLGIAHLLDRRPSQLSGGQRQRVAMGRAIVRRPKLFLFDEPLSNLDAQLRGQVRAEIKSLHQKLGTTIIYVTHDQVEAMTLADRIVILRGGEIEQQGTPYELYNNPKSVFVGGFMGSPAMNFTRGIIRDGALDFPGCGRVDLAGGRYGNAPEGREVIVGIRPEHFSPAREGHTALAPQVQMIEPLGADTIVHVAIGNNTLTARLPPDVQPHPGSTVALDLDADKIQLFDPKTELALA